MTRTNCEYDNEVIDLERLETSIRATISEVTQLDDSLDVDKMNDERMDEHSTFGIRSRSISLSGPQLLLICVARFEKTKK